MCSDDADKAHLVDGKYAIGDLVAMDELHAIFEKFTQATGFTIGLLDHPGLNILIATGWRDICTKFHRVCPASAANCTKSNRHLRDQLKEPGDVVVERCDNGLVDCAVPIVIKGKHIASLATGQILLEEPDTDRFRRQAELFGFDVHEYLDAVKDIPVVSEEKIRNVTDFMGEMAHFISRLGYSELIAKEESLRLENEISERKRAEEMLRRTRGNFHRSLEESPLGVRIVTVEGETIYANQAILDIYGYDSIEDLKTTRVKKRYTAESYAEFQIRREKRKRGDCDPSEYEISIVRKDGEVRHLRVARKEILWDGERQFQVIYQDITERKQLEKTLRESAAFLKAILESTADGILAVNEHGKVVSANARFLQMWRIPVELMEQKDDAKLLDHVLGQLEEPEVFLRRVQALYVSTEEDFDTLYFKDGRIFERFSCPLIMDGLLSGRVWSFRNVTTQRKAEDALRESEKRWQFALEGAGDGVWDWNVQTNEVFFSRQWKTMLGYEEDEIGNTLDELDKRVHPDDKERCYEDLQEHFRGEKPVYQNEHRVLCKDGKYRWILDRGKVIEWADDGKPLRVIGTHADITERKLTEEQIEMLKHSIDVLCDGVYWMDSDNKFIYVNDAGCKDLGYTREELIGRTVSDVNPRATAEAMKRAWERLRKDGFFSTESTHRRKDGGEFPVEIVATYVQFGGKEYNCGFARDITLRKQAEEEHRTMEERLQRAEKMEALGTLAGGVAHDLNNVLGIVVGFSELLLNEVNNESSAAKSHAETICIGGQRAAAIVNDLLTLTRRGVPSRKPLNLNDIVKGCKELTEFEKMSSHHPGIPVTTDLETDLLNISGSSVHLEKSMINLISNALEAMPDGGALTIKTRNQYLDKPVSGYDEIKEGDYVVLSISDTGEGISDADLKRIFEPFYTKKAMGRSGTGLGLAVVWGTVKDHYGYINVESEEGKGTTFTLYFPVTRGEIAPEQVAVSSSEYMGNGETILVVDDVKEQRDLATTMLARLNYKVCSVSSGEEAVKYVQEHTVDLVVLDMIMDPGLDGLDTYLKMIEVHPHQKAVIVSGFSETERVTKAQALGAGPYVKKPYVLEKLGLAVKKELERPA